MDKTDPYAVARAIADLNVWEKASRHNWALVSQTHEKPVIASVVHEQGPGPVTGRLLLFPGFEVFSRYVLSRQMPDFGVAMSPLDFPHDEAVGLRDGSVEIFSYEPGYVPLPPDSLKRRDIAPLLYECYGVMMRLEENPELPLAYVREQKMFARKELVEDKWIDGPIAIPQPNMQDVEQIGLAKAEVTRAAALPILPKEAWELDFVLVSAYHTPGPRPRFLYLLAAVDAETGERRVWERMSVEEGPDGLLHLWEHHAERLLRQMIAVGHVPGALHIRSRRMARFLRPLALQLPFKLVQHAKLPSLEAVLELAIRTRKV